MTKLARLAAALGLAVLLLAGLPLNAAAATADYAVLGGWFYSQTGGGTGKGFNLLDTGFDSRGHVTRFFSEFNRLGGVPVLGYPASNVFSLPDGFIYQATQAALLQWHPEDQVAGGVELANVFDLLSQTGHDKDLATLGIPAPIANDGSGGDFARAIDARFAWLTQPQIKDRYLANPNPAANKTWGPMDSIQLYGLPTSLPQRAGPFIIQRFQRVAFQLWLDAVPGQPAPGSVVPILGGDLAKQFGVVPPSARQAQDALSTAAPQPVTVDGPAAVQPAITLLLQYDQSHGSNYMKNLADHHVQVKIGPLPDANALGYFLVDSNTILISNVATYEETHDVADLIAHESSHAWDYWTGVDVLSNQGCLNTEINAFRHQVDVWNWFYPGGKPAPNDRIEAYLNHVAQTIATNPPTLEQFISRLAPLESRDPTTVANTLINAYHLQCSQTH